MPLFKRLPASELNPYAWIYKEDEVKENELNTDAFSFKPITYAGLRDLKLTNEYGKYPTAEIELSDPEYKKLSSQDPKTDLITRLKIGTLISVKFGYRSSHIVWRSLKVIESELSFTDGTVILKIKAIAGHKIRDTTTSDVYTKSMGVTAIERLAQSIGMEANLKRLLTEEVESLAEEVETNGSASIKHSAHKRGLDYYISPTYGTFLVETPFKYELIKKGAHPMRLTYGYPISSIASLDYKREHPKKGGSNAGGKLGNTQQKREQIGLNPGDKTFTSYIRGAFKIRNAPSDTDYFLIDPPSKEQATSFFPIAQGHLYEDVVGLYSELSKVNVKRVVKVKGDTVVEGSPIIVSANRLKTLLLNNSTDKHYEFSPDGFYYEAPAEGSPLSVQDATKVEVRVYTFKQASDRKAPPPKDKPQSTKSVVDADKETESYRDDVDTLVRIPLGQEDESKLKDTTSPGYKAHQRIKELEAQAKADPDKYRIRRGVAEDKSKYVVLQTLVTTEAPSGGNKANKEIDDGAKVDDAVGGTDIAMADQTPKSSEVKPPASARARRRAPKTELTIKFKAGDWSMRVGRIVEIVDVYNSIDGFYYINKETHTVNVEGFHTEVVCRKALKGEVKRYGAGKVKALKGTSKPKGGEQAEKAKAEPALKVISQQEQARLVEEKRLERERSKAVFEGDF
jgi:hypothetical protein